MNCKSIQFRCHHFKFALGKALEYDVSCPALRALPCSMGICEISRKGLSFKKGSPGIILFVYLVRVCCDVQ